MASRKELGPGTEKEPWEDQGMIVSSKEGDRFNAIDPAVTVVAGGYDPSLATDVYLAPPWDVDAVVRGEGDVTFRELVRCYERNVDPSDVAGVTWRDVDGFHCNPARPASSLSGDEVRLPHPLFEGDTLYAESEVLETRESRSRPHMGIVRLRTTGTNQDGDVVIEFQRTVLVYRRGHVPKDSRPEPRRGKKT